MGGKIFLIFCVFSIAHQLTVQCSHVWNFKSLTWNMQGSKWTELKTKLNEDVGNYDIVALQECGGKPGSAVKVSRKVSEEDIGSGRATEKMVDYVPLSGAIDEGDTGPFLTPFDTGANDFSVTNNQHLVHGHYNVHEYTWNLGSSSRGRKYYLYHFEVQDENNRNNMAILSQKRAEEVYVFSDPQGKRRPVFGIRIGKNAFFSVHAPAFAANKVADALKGISDFLSNNAYVKREVTSWIFLGDFNRNDAIKHMPASNHYDKQIVQPMSTNGSPQVTQASGNTLDYAVIVAKKILHMNPQMMTANRVNLVSDHYAVELSPRQQ